MFDRTVQRFSSDVENLVTKASMEYDIDVKIIQKEMGFADILHTEVDRLFTPCYRGKGLTLSS